MPKSKQCIAWDGAMIAILDADVTHCNAEIISKGLTYDAISARNIDAGAFGTVVLAALSSPNELKPLRKILEDMTLPELIAFYSRAVNIGIIGPEFSFQFMAVIKNRPAPDNYPRFGDYYAIGIEVSQRGMAVHYSQRYNCLAIGKEAYAAMLLMKEGYTALEAVTAQSVPRGELYDYQMARRGVSYDAGSGEYSYTSFYDAKETARSLPFYHLACPPQTQKEIDDSF